MRSNDAGPCWTRWVRCDRRGRRSGARQRDQARGQLLLAAAIEAMGEAFALTRKYGVAPADVLDIVNGRLFRSPIYENYGKLIAEERYEPAGFKLKYGLKDIRLALGAADEVAAPMPLASLIRDRYLSGVARGWSDIDWAALARIAAATPGSPPRDRRDDGHLVAVLNGAAKPPRKRTSSSFK